MNSIEFYKSFYDRELKRRFDLDNALNIPIGLIAILIALASYIISNLQFLECIRIDWIISIMTVISVGFILLAIYYLSITYNNVFKGHSYLNFKNATEIRKFQLELESYNTNQTEEKDKIEFENKFIEKLNSYTDSHIQINDFRQKKLRNAKSAIIASLFLILIALILVIIKKYFL